MTETQEIPEFMMGKIPLREIIRALSQYRGGVPAEQRVLVISNPKARTFVNERVAPGGLTVIAARGADIPALVADNEGLWGVTTTEYTAGYAIGAESLRSGLFELSLPWYDNSFKFRQPALCLLGKKEKMPSEQMPSDKGRTVIAVNRQITDLSESLVENYFRQQGINVTWPWEDGNGYGRSSTVEFKPMDGELESAVRAGFADLCVDIVATGKTCQDYNLRIIGPELFLVGLAIVVNKNYLSQL